ncbi:MAG: DUF4386 family protein [bacterium]|nr:DUF4386 family protein [bacterium]MCP5068948.1 DUF4386 family protein [bacterium]
MTQQRTDYALTAAVLITHVVVLGTGFNVLVAVFDFPEILREPAAERFALFANHAGVLIPTYFALALTGITQVALAVLLGHLLGAERSAILSLAVVFGVLTGLLQVLGFIRWPVLIPYLVEAWQTGTPLEQVALIEGAFNRYVGMAAGELVGFLCQAIWTTLLAATMLGHPLFDRSLGRVGIMIGLATFPVALEPLRGPFAVFAALAPPVNAALAVWLVLLAVSLLRTQVPEGRGAPLGRGTWAIGIAFWVASIAPAVLG